jgi:hypothetical protein
MFKLRNAVPTTESTAAAEMCIKILFAKIPERFIQSSFACAVCGPKLT